MMSVIKQYMPGKTGKKDEKKDEKKDPVRWRHTVRG